MKKYHNRFKDAKWYNPGEIVSVGGAGGLGSWLLIFLTRIGCNIDLFEMDTIDYTNMAGQAYPISSIGQTKADTIVKVCKEFSGKPKIYQKGKLTEESEVRPIVFSAFDQMYPRKIMFEKWKKLKKRKVFIDGRMLAESGQVFVITPENEELYELVLFDDADIEDQSCSYKATSHTGALGSSLMVAAFTNFLSNEKRGVKIRSLPIFTRYMIPSLTVLTYEDKEMVEFFSQVDKEEMHDINS